LTILLLQSTVQYRQTHKQIQILSLQASFTREVDPAIEQVSPELMASNLLHHPALEDINIENHVPPVEKLVSSFALYPH
jgi:hypothetical protein